MCNAIASTQDILGFRRTRLGAEYALKNASSSHPANESIVVMNWVRFDMGGTTVGGHFVGVGPLEDAGGERVSMRHEGTDSVSLGVNDGVWQDVDVPIPDNTDHLWCIVVDRDNTLLDIWLDGVLVSSEALTNDPDLLDDNDIQMNNSSGGVNSRFSCTCWRGVILSLTNAATPTQAQFATAFKAMLNPHSPMHATLTDATGTVYNDYNLGEGLYGSGTITDNGTSSDDLTIQGALTIEDVRTRNVVPWTNPANTFYTLTPGYTATTGAGDDFGFAVQPVIVRLVLGDMHGVSAYTRLSNAAGTHGTGIAINAGVSSLWTRRAGANQYIPLIGDQPNGGDLFIVIDGTDVAFYYGGQHIGNMTLAGTIDLSGNCFISMDGRDACCRLAAWNPASIPGDFLTEMLACTNDPESDPASLGTPLVDFALNDVTLPLATSTNVANAGSGGGTLVISAQRSTSCKTMLWAPPAA